MGRMVRDAPWRKLGDFVMIMMLDDDDGDVIEFEIRHVVRQHSI